MTIEDISKTEQIFPVLYIFLTIMTCQYVIEIFLGCRQLKCLKIKEIPEDLKHFCFFLIFLSIYFVLLELNQEEFEKSQSYQFETLSFSLFNKSTKLILHFFLLLTYFHAKIWEWTKTLTWINPNSEFQRFCLFFSITYIISKIFDIPSTIYSHFVIEENHGFNKITLKIFITDEIKGIILNFIFTFIFVYIYLWIVQRTGELFYIYAQIFIIIFLFIMMLIYPNFIAPLFNKFDEINSGELFDEIKKLAIINKFPLSKIYSVDGSKVLFEFLNVFLQRSSHSNAYFYGFWKNKRIVLFDTLIQQMSTKEILGVLCNFQLLIYKQTFFFAKGHELAHWKFSHLWYLLSLSLLEIFGIFYIFSFFRHSNSLYRSFGYTDKSILIGTTLFFDFIEPLTYAFEILKLKLTRKFEFQADSYAVQMNYASELARALLQLSKSNKSSLINDPLYAAYYYSHPTFPERIKQLENFYPNINFQENIENKEETVIDKQEEIQKSDDNKKNE